MDLVRDMADVPADPAFAHERREVDVVAQRPLAPRMHVANLVPPCIDPTDGQSKSQCTLLYEEGIVRRGKPVETHVLHENLFDLVG